MNHLRNPHRRAVAVLLSATAFIATPAIAQDGSAPPAPQSVAPPRVVPTVTDAPAAATQAAPATAPMGDTQSSTPVNPAAAEQAAAEQAERRAERRMARPATARTATARTASRPVAARASAAPAAAAAEAPAATTATPVAAPPATSAEAPSAAPPPTTATPDATPIAETRTKTTTTEGGTRIWPLALIGLLIVAAGAFFFLRRRNAAEAYDEDVYAEAPVAQDTAQPMTIEPIAAPPTAVAPVPAAPAFLDRTPVVDDRSGASSAPAVPDDATVAIADEADVAALTAAAPVENRPWLELAMRPVRAGTSDDEALVEIELTVGNAGEVRAEDVRISTFMLQDNDDGEMERRLVRATDTAVDPVSIEPGEGTRVDATLAMQKSELTGNGFQPIVVADARYRLPNGGEGRTSASFLIGVSADGGTALTPIQTARPQMRDDIEAQLYGQPQHS